MVLRSCLESGFSPTMLTVSPDWSWISSARVSSSLRGRFAVIRRYRARFMVFLGIAVRQYLGLGIFP